MYAKKIKFGVLVHVIVSIEYLKYYASMKKKKKNDSRNTCDEIIGIPETVSLDSIHHHQ